MTTATTLTRAWSLTLALALLTPVAYAQGAPTRQPVDSTNAPDGVPGFGPPPVALAHGLSRLVPREESGWFLEPKIQRLADLEIITGLPDLLGVCVEINPHPLISIEGCGGTIVLVTSGTLEVKSRLLHFQSFALVNDRPESGYQMSFGPGVGGRVAYVINTAIDFLPSNSPRNRVVGGVEGLLSFEYVNWWSSRFGLSFQVDAGMMFPIGLPGLRLSLGFVFGDGAPTAAHES